jgi:hypothetical protein
LLGYKLLVQILGTAATAAFFSSAGAVTLLLVAVPGDGPALLSLQMVSLIMQVSQTVEIAAYTRAQTVAVDHCDCHGCRHWSVALSAQPWPKKAGLHVATICNLHGVCGAFDVFGQAMTAHRLWPDFTVGLALVDGALSVGSGSMRISWKSRSLPVSVAATLSNVRGEAD